MSNQTRVKIGSGIGLLLGLCYGLMAGNIDRLILPGIPLRVDNSRILADTLGWSLGGLAAGCLTAWPASTFLGVLAGAAAMALYGVGRSLLQIGGFNQDLARALLIFIPTLLPSVVLGAPVSGLLRWATNAHLEALHHSGRPRLFRLGRTYLGVLAVSLLVGSFAQMSADEQKALQQVQRMLQVGLDTRAGLPDPLRRIEDFRARAGGDYTLDLQVDISADTGFAGSTAVTTYVVDVLFDSGLHFTCLVGQSLTQPLCSEQ